MSKKPTTQFELDVYKAETERIQVIAQANNDLYRARSSRTQLFLRFILFTVLGLIPEGGLIGQVGNWLSENKALHKKSVETRTPAPDDAPT